MSCSLSQNGPSQDQTRPVSFSAKSFLPRAVLLCFLLWPTRCLISTWKKHPREHLGLQTHPSVLALRTLQCRPLNRVYGHRSGWGYHILGKTWVYRIEKDVRALARWSWWEYFQCLRQLFPMTENRWLWGSIGYFNSVNSALQDWSLTVCTRSCLTFSPWTSWLLYTTHNPHPSPQWLWPCPSVWILLHPCPSPHTLASSDSTVNICSGFNWWLQGPLCRESFLTPPPPPAAPGIVYPLPGARAAGHPTRVPGARQKISIPSSTRFPRVVTLINWASFVLWKTDLNGSGCANLEIGLFSWIKEEYLDFQETVWEEVWYDK